MIHENRPVADTIAELQLVIKDIDDNIDSILTKDKKEQIEDDLERARRLLDRMRKAADEGREWSNLPADDVDRGIQYPSSEPREAVTRPSRIVPSKDFVDL